MPRRFSFPRQYRVRKSQEFSGIQASGRKLHSKHFVILVEASRLSYPRLGITVSKKVDARAVKRNGLKRRIREAFRMCRHRFVRGLDIVVIARKNSVDCPSAEVKRELVGAFYHHGLFD